MKELRVFWPFYGGKWRLAPRVNHFTADQGRLDYRLKPFADALTAALYAAGVKA